ncbi:hypothetical protein SAMN02982990_00123 [Photorhabdus luminescens]|uniref:Uncharacterized protein n=1 Tax=Photorhabdus luminescens TaxID=29488 RepID=A0A1G5PPV0_PHOLU|nr:hypothetical protein SAMN02982990_00123 [Photorhabdus luminescens]
MTEYEEKGVVIKTTLSESSADNFTEKDRYLLLTICKDVYIFTF